MKKVSKPNTILHYFQFFPKFGTVYEWEVVEKKKTMWFRTVEWKNTFDSIFLGPTSTLHGIFLKKFSKFRKTNRKTEERINKIVTLGKYETNFLVEQCNLFILIQLFNLINSTSTVPVKSVRFSVRVHYNVVGAGM